MIIRTFRAGDSSHYMTHSLLSGGDGMARFENGLLRALCGSEFHPATAQPCKRGAHVCVACRRAVKALKTNQQPEK